MAEVVPAVKVEHKITLAFMVAFLAIALAGIGAYLNAKQLLAANHLVTHTYDVLAKAGDLLGSVQGANSGAQGFFLTGEETSLVPYDDGLEAIGGELDDLRRLTADNPAQQQNIAQLQTESNRLIAYLHRRVEVRRQGGLPAVLPQLGTEGKDIVDQIRFRAATIRNAELKLLKQRGEGVARTTDETLKALLLLAGLALLLAAAFYRFIRYDLAQRRRWFDMLRDSDKRFRGVWASAPGAMFITNPDGEIRLANPEAEKLFGYPHGELIGSRLRTLLQELPKNTAHEGDALESPEGSGALEGCTGKRKDNTLFPIELSRSPLTLGKERLVICAIRDCSSKHARGEGA